MKILNISKWNISSCISSYDSCMFEYDTVNRWVFRHLRKVSSDGADGILSPCNVTRGSGMTCHWIRPNVRHIGTLLMVLISTITADDMSFCTSLRNFIQIGPPTAISIFKMADLRHLGFYGSNNGFFEKPMYNFLPVVNRDHGSKLLSFWENRVFAFWQQTDRQTNKQTDGLARHIKPLSLSRAAA